MTAARLAASGLVAALLSLTAAARGRAPQGTTPPVTILYQNFPNPFPTAASNTTCLWFDLDHADVVTLAIYTLRGRLVRTIVPSPAVPSQLPAGYYGRQGGGATGTCDARFSWDGRGADGHSVPPGIYLARLHAAGAWQTRKIVFRGP